MSARGTFVALAVVAAFSTAGCSVSMEPKAAAMTPQLGASAAHHPESAFLVVRGGGEQWRISNAEFHKAVESALKQSQIFQALTGQAAADYRLDVVLGSVRQPLAGGDFTVDLETIWNLYSLRSRTTVWQKTVSSTCTVSVGQSFNATNRLRMATECAARSNVEAGIAKLAGAPIGATMPVASNPAEGAEATAVASGAN